MANSRPQTPPLPSTLLTTAYTNQQKHNVPTDMDVEPNSYSLEKFRLYETRARFYLVGSDRAKRFFRVLKIDRSEPSDLNISEDPMVYSQKEVNNLLKRIDEGNRSTGGLTFIAKVYGIVGCIKFMESYYLIVVTKRRQIGAICGHPIYSIEESQMITVPHSSVQSDIAQSKTELRYKKLFSSVDLTNDFFYSYTYPIMQTLQKNVTNKETRSMPYENMFVWNSFLTDTIRSQCNNTLWTIALVHGFFQQVRVSIFGREFVITLISRRSRHFAGTRFLKRGVNDFGWVANDVETEQIVVDEEAGTFKGKMSSVVQMRGSIPLFWSQEASRLSPKPDIILQRYDPTYEATKLHFDDLEMRYGSPVIVLNLIKTYEKRPREMMLRREYTNAVGYLNQILPVERQLKFIHWDFHKFAKSKSPNVLAVLIGIASEALDLTGFYYSGKPISNKRSTAKFNQTATRESSLIDHRNNRDDIARISSNIKSMTHDQEKESNKNPDSGCHFQSGVLRTNCIDCLDRTNVSQYAYGLAALGRQLHAMGLTSLPKVDSESSIASKLLDMYLDMGDALAHQYGGSGAHNTVLHERQGKWKATTQSREFINTIKRYYSNAYTDGEKQDAINLFLGYFKPQEGKPALWELDSDYYLHVTGNGCELDPNTDKNSSNIPIEGMRTALSSFPSECFETKFSPVPACKQDFSRLKLTSFDKLLETTGSSIKNVRLCSELDMKSNGMTTSHGMAPDAAEVQLKSPNWLFGQRKQEACTSASKTGLHENVKGQSEGNLTDSESWVSSWLSIDEDQGDTFDRYLKLASAHEDESWYGGSLIYGEEESSEAYRHYAGLCQGPAMELFDPDQAEKENHYRAALSMGTNDGSDDTLYEEMQAAFEGFNHIGSDLGIGVASKAFARDTCLLTRWIVGEEKVQSRRNEI